MAFVPNYVSWPHLSTSGSCDGVEPTMSVRLAIVWYAGFWDIPRLFSVRVGGGYLVFDSPFDDVLDDYRPDFTASLVESDAELTEDAIRSAAETASVLGTIPVSELEFDESRRAFVAIPDTIGGHLISERAPDHLP